MDTSQIVSADARWELPQEAFFPPFVPVFKKQNEAFVFEFHGVLLMCPIFWNEYYQLASFIYSHNRHMTRNL